jgi:hypothetical protein
MPSIEQEERETLIREDKLRKVSDHVFEVADENWEKEGRKPLQWRRHWQIVHLPLTNVKITTACTVQAYKLDDFFGLGMSEEPRPLFKQ